MARDPDRVHLGRVDEIEPRLERPVEQPERRLLSAVQPNTLPPRQSGATRSAERPSCRLSMILSHRWAGYGRCGRRLPVAKAVDRHMAPHDRPRRRRHPEGRPWLQGGWTMARSIRAMLTGVAVAGLVAFGAGTARAQDVTVMTSVPGLNFPFFVHMLKAMQDEGKALGVKTVELDGQNSAPKQTADVEAAVVQGVNGIVISPIDVNAMAPAMQTAIDNGVPVVTIDRRVAGVERHHRPCRRRQRQGRRGPGRVGDGDLPERRQRSSTCRASPAPARPSTATRACTTSSTRTATSTSSWPSRPPTSPATRACRSPRACSPA